MSTDTREERLERRIRDLYATDRQFADTRPSERITKIAISAVLSRSNAAARSLSSAMVCGSSVPDVSVTHVPFWTRGLGMLLSDSAPPAAVASRSTRHTVETTKSRKRVTEQDFSSAAVRWPGSRGVRL